MNRSDTQAQLQSLQRDLDRLVAEIQKVIVGQDAIIRGVLTCLLAGGHGLLEGVPGLGKTLLIRTLAQAVHLSFARIQFTPDLMPADIVGTSVLVDAPGGGRQLEYQPGPIFSHIVLADEVNRATPKTQSALLEAMQEGRVTTAGEQRSLPQPFFVLATQNPIEMEGTYPLPEAQQDRFMFKILVNYPKRDEERAIVLATTTDVSKTVEPVLNAEEILALQAIVRRVPVAPAVVDHALDLVRQTRVKDLEGEIPEFVRRYVSWGAGPRASQYLILAAKARAVVQGRYHVTMDDVRAAALPVLRHRILCNFAAEAEGVTPDTVIEKLLEQTPAAAGALSKDPQVAAALSDN